MSSPFNCNPIIPPTPVTPPSGVDNCKAAIINQDTCTGPQGTTGSQGTQGTQGIQGLQGLQGSGVNTACCCWIGLNYIYVYTGEGYSEGYQVYTECWENPIIIWQVLVDEVWEDLDPQPTPNNILFSAYNNPEGVAPGAYRVKVPSTNPICCDKYSPIVQIYAV